MGPLTKSRPIGVGPAKREMRYRRKRDFRNLGKVAIFSEAKFPGFSSHHTCVFSAVFSSVSLEKHPFPSGDRI